MKKSKTLQEICFMKTRFPKGPRKVIMKAFNAGKKVAGYHAWAQLSAEYHRQAQTGNGDHFVANMMAAAEKALNPTEQPAHA